MLKFEELYRPREGTKAEDREFPPIYHDPFGVPPVIDTRKLSENSGIGLNVT